MDDTISKSFAAAISLFQHGQLEEAIAACRHILEQQPRHLDALQMVGLSLARLHRNDEALVPLEAALRIAPTFAPLCNNLGELYRQLGRLTEAEQLLRQALTRQDRFAEAAMNLGNVLKDQNRYAESIEWFQQAVTWRPNYANAHLNLANTLYKEGRSKRAIQHYLEYLLREPNRCDVLLSLGGAYADVGDAANAVSFYRKAESLDPDNSEVDAALGHAAYVEGDTEQARLRYQKIAARNPDCLLKRLRASQVCDIIAQSNASIDEYRAHLTTALDELSHESLYFDLDQLHSSGAEPPMMLAYQGRDDRAIKQQYAALFARCLTPRELPRRTGKSRLGVVVTNGHEGVYVECLGRLVARLAKSRELDVTVVCSRAGKNIIPQLIGGSPLHYLALPDRVADAAALVAEAQFDMLHYWEVGTDSMNYFLPFFRPAPIQSACWGWPVTTGQPQIDYFVSSQWIEPDQAKNDYTEELIQLETLPTWYARPPLPTALHNRAALGLSDRARIYLCTQNLRKYHPDFDPVIAEILRRDHEGYVYAIDDARPEVGRKLHARFASGFPDVADRLAIIPRKERVDYLNLVALADVVLDTPHYGGGANSIYDAFACGTPIVTHPGQFHRGRYAQAVCCKLDLPEMIANSSEEYVSRAVRIASDVDLRESISRAIRERGAQLFEDDSAVRQHEEFFLTAIAASRQA